MDRAAALGMRHLAITDHSGLYGAPRFCLAARERGIHPVIGAELILDGGYHIVLLAKDRRGYSNLSRLISHAQLTHTKGKAALDFEYLRQYPQGLIALSGCRKGEIASLLLKGDRKAAYEAARRYAALFPEGDFFIELQNQLLPDDQWLLRELVDLANRLGLPYVATNDVHYALREEHELHDVKVCIGQKGIPLEEARGILFPNSERFLKGAQEMLSLFPSWPEAVRNSVEIARRCEVELDFRDQRLPPFTLPEGHDSPSQYLQKLFLEGIRKKYQPPTPQVFQQLEHELEIIDRMGLPTYFLIVWDIVRFAKERGIPAQGRGSAANSLVAYALDITKVDPIKYNFLFERFLNPEGSSSPDIDIDFSQKHREEVIQYVYQKYGEERTGMVCTYITYQPRLAIRDVGKVLGLPPDVIDRLAKSIDRWTGSLAELVEEHIAEREFRRSKVWQRFVSLCEQIQDHPRHLSIHVGGMVITANPLVEVVPIERATMPGRNVIQWDKAWAEEVGLIKTDLLSLRTLSLTHDARQMVRERHGIDVDPETLPLDDPKIYEVLQQADSIGMFQVESRAQRVTLPRLKPQRFEDLIVEVALIRPGPIKLAVPFLRRRRGEEPVTYHHPWLEDILKDTLGVIVFQEDVMRVAMRMASFTPTEADRLRRAMSSKRSHAEMERLRGRFMQGALRNGVSEQVAQQIFDMIAGFAEFGFCKSHAAAFALTAYYTAHLKIYHAPEFYCALLNNEPMGFYDVEVVANDAKRHGVKILPPHINLSQKECTVERNDVRLGFQYVDGVGEAGAGAILAARQKGPFPSLEDFWRRVSLRPVALENLILIGAMDCWGLPKRELLWELRRIQALQDGHGGQPQLEKLVFPSQPVSLRPHTELEETALDYRILGMTTGERAHVMAFYRDWLRDQGACSTEELREAKDGEKVRVGGLVVVRQAPVTARGILFMTLEDEFDLVDVVVYPDIWRRFRRLIHERSILLVEGRVQREGAVISVRADRFESPPELKQHMKHTSHDFR